MNCGRFEPASVSNPAAPSILWRAGLLACFLIVTLTTLSPSAAVADNVDRETPPIFIVGHRGAPLIAPENTIASHEAALRLGANIIELDVRMTRDGHFVVIHDATVDRTTNGEGRVSKMTLEEIRALDAGAWKGPQFAGARVPTLREALANLKGRAGIDIDFKDGPKNSGARLADLLDELGYNDGTLVTFYARTPGRLRKLNGVVGRYDIRPGYAEGDRIDRFVRENKVRIMGLPRYAFSRRSARDISNRELKLFLNVMGGKESRSVFEAGVRSGARFIQTNNVEGLSRYLTNQNLKSDCVPSIELTCWSPTRLATKRSETSETSTLASVGPATAPAFANYRNIVTTR